MRQLNLIVQTSLDGFVAGVHGEFDNFIGGEENLGFVCSIIDEGDTIMLGRVSYDLLNAHWPTAAGKSGATKNEIKYSNWYNAASKIVVSTTLESVNRVHVLDDIRSSDINGIKNQEGKNILVFGSPSVSRQILDLNLVDNMWLIVHPVIFGDGIPLFKKRDQVSRLELVNSVQLTSGTLCNKYSIK